MSQMIAKKVGRKILGEQAKAYEPRDPHYETYTDTRGRVKSRKRKMPSGLSKRDERILKSVRRRAHYLDKGFTLCGFRFGWTAIFGLIPFAGDIVAFLLSYFLVLRKCRQADLPLLLEQRMAFNQAVSIGVGMVPLVGDIMLAVWKTNSRNAALLEEFLIKRAEENLRNSETGGAGTSTRGRDSEAAMARAAISSAHIDGRSGERLGAPPPYVLSDEVARGRKKSGKPKKWYGWMGGNGGESQESIVSDGAGVEHESPVVPSGSGSATVAVPSPAATAAASSGKKKKARRQED